MERIQKTQILKDLNKKMVLLVGPRQSGKTWLAKDIAKDFPESVYLNYDQLLDKKIILDQSWLPSTDILIFDELHKMAGWKNYLKGVYDTKPSSMRLLVTGSARLDLYDNLGDSLAGRYYRHRLLPFSPAELTQLDQKFTLDELITKSGYPEPFLTDDIIEIKRWRMQYISSLLTTDVFEIDQILNIKALQLVFNLLRRKVGSPISYSSIAEDVAVSPATVKKYIQILEALFVIFRVTPYSKNIARSLLKEPKIYFFDSGLIEGDEGAKFENLVANSLLKSIFGRIDYLAEDLSLNYIRTKDGMEIDFAIINQNEIEQIIEVKLSNSDISKPLKYFHEKYSYPAVQILKNIRHEYINKDIKVLDMNKYLSKLFL